MSLLQSRRSLMQTACSAAQRHPTIDWPDTIDARVWSVLNVTIVMRNWVISQGLAAARFCTWEGCNVVLLSRKGVMLTSGVDNSTTGVGQERPLAQSAVPVRYLISRPVPDLLGVMHGARETTALPGQMIL